MRIATAPTGLETGVNLTCNPAYQALTLQGSGHNFHVRPHLLCATDYSLSHSIFSELIAGKQFSFFLLWHDKPANETQVFLHSINSVRQICAFFSYSAANLRLRYSELEFINILWGARNREEIGLSYWSARLHGLAELISWNQFLGSLKVLTFRLSSYIVLVKVV